MPLPSGTRIGIFEIVAKLGEGLQLRRPEPLFDVEPYFFGGAGRNYDVSPDGARFIMVRNPSGDQGSSFSITIVLNWLEELRSRIR